MINLKEFDDEQVMPVKINNCSKKFIFCKTNNSPDKPSILSLEINANSAEEAFACLIKNFPDFKAK